MRGYRHGPRLPYGIPLHFSGHAFDFQLNQYNLQYNLARCCMSFDMKDLHLSFNFLQHFIVCLNYTCIGRYEVGKYQTLGGSLFQQGTVCTIATYDPYSMEDGGGDIGIYLVIFLSPGNTCILHRILQ